MHLQKLSVFTLFLSSATIAYAEIEPILTIGYEGGGDKLVITTSDDLYAGGGLSFGAGASFSKPGSEMSLRVLLSYLFNSIEFNAPTGNAEVTAFPLEASVFNRWGRNELGIGLITHLNATYEICFDGLGCNRTKFDNPIGASLQYHYIFSKAETSSYTTDTYIGVKLTAMDYKKGSNRFNADSIGLYLGSKF